MMKNTLEMYIAYMKILHDCYVDIRDWIFLDLGVFGGPGTKAQ